MASYTGKNSKPWKRQGNPKYRKGNKFKHNPKQSKQNLEDQEIKTLRDEIENIKSGGFEKFTDFPLCERTKKGLQDAKYITPTDIQREAIGLALQGNDILGAAKTGSGKTLAFLIPVLEKLYHNKWSASDGLGALIISPTRELAFQIFEVLRKVGKYHDFSAGLVIGGKHIKEEAERINKTNIVICTPGRLLQHMDETAFFVADNLQVLVLDEADRILDLGFQQTMNAIIENLPPQRQTLLFSATQTKSVKDLARLSLKDPMYVSVHEKAANSTPAQLQQSYIVCELHDKISMLWSFIKQHLHKKIMVFISSCKQVRFVFESFRHLKPGMTILALHGGMKQMKRMEVYQQFCRKQHAILLATDIAARGLDFPAVHWVVQLDCPEDANTYIHRAGRTARYETDGEALLVLLPSEEKAMVANLQKKKIPIEKIRVNQNKLWSIQKKLESLCASDVTMKEFAQAAFVAYLKHVFFQHDKEVFSVSRLNLEEFATSLGLAVTPRIRFLQKQQKLQEARKRNVRREDEGKEPPKASTSMHVASSETSSSEEEQNEDEEDESGSASEPESEESDSKLTKQETLAAVKGQQTDKSKMKKKAPKMNLSSDEEDMGDLFQVKQVIKPDDSNQTSSDSENDVVPDLETAKAKKPKKVSKASIAKKLQKKNIQVNTKVAFDDEGEQVIDPHKQSKAIAGELSDVDEGGIDISQAQKRLREEDTHDKALFRQKVKQKHREQRLKEKMARRRRAGLVDEEEEAEVQLMTPEDGEERASSPQLPDLDKFYGSGSEEEEGDEGRMENDDDSDIENDDDDDDDDSDDDDYSEDDDDDEEEEEISSKRRKLLSDDTMDTGLSLMDDEALALKLLGQ